MKRASRLTNLTLLVAVCLFFAWCGGCEPPLQNLENRLAKVRDMRLPIDARAGIILPLDKQDNRIWSGNWFGVLLLDNSASLVDAAKEVFGKIFKEVNVSGKIVDPHFLIKVNPNTKVHGPVYEAVVDCEITYGNNDALGTYKAEETEVTMVVEQAGLDRAYRKAFGAIVVQMLDDPNMAKAIARGANETKAKKTAVDTQQESEYKYFVDGVVTIEMKKKVQWATSPLSGNGSGFFIDTKGTILTNSHVVKDSNKMYSAKVLYKNKEYDFDVLASDEWNDLALIRPKGLTKSPKLSVMLNGYSVAVGDDVIVVGSPITKELERTVSKGIISAFRDIQGYKMIQTDAAINPGNSGGPLVHLKTQRVIGVVIGVIKGMRWDQGQGLGFAVPAETIHEFLAKHRDKYQPSAD